MLFAFAKVLFGIFLKEYVLGYSLFSFERTLCLRFEFQGKKIK